MEKTNSESSKIKSKKLDDAQGNNFNSLILWMVMSAAVLIMTGVIFAYLKRRDLDQQPIDRPTKPKDPENPKNPEEPDLPSDKLYPICPSPYYKMNEDKTCTALCTDEYGLVVKNNPDGSCPKYVDGTADPIVVGPAECPPGYHAPIPVYGCVPINPNDNNPVISPLKCPDDSWSQVTRYSYASSARACYACSKDDVVDPNQVQHCLKHSCPPNTIEKDHLCVPISTKTPNYTKDEPNVCPYGTKDTPAGCLAYCYNAERQIVPHIVVKTPDGRESYQCPPVLSDEKRPVEPISIELDEKSAPCPNGTINITTRLGGERLCFDNQKIQLALPDCKNGTIGMNTRFTLGDYFMIGENKAYIPSQVIPICYGKRCPDGSLLDPVTNRCMICPINNKMVNGKCVAQMLNKI